MAREPARGECVFSVQSIRDCVCKLITHTLKILWKRESVSRPGEIFDRILIAGANRRIRSHLIYFPRLQQTRRSRALTFIISSRMERFFSKAPPKFFGFTFGGLSNEYENPQWREFFHKEKNSEKNYEQKFYITNFLL